jgi:hypothetical protein
MHTGTYSLVELSYEVFIFIVASSFTRLSIACTIPSYCRDHVQRAHTEASSPVDDLQTVVVTVERPDRHQLQLTVGRSELLLLASAFVA